MQRKNKFNKFSTKKIDKTIA